MAQYSIREVENLSGVKAHTLRIWEQRYTFLKPKRTKTNIRYYDDEQLHLLVNIGTLNRNGEKISKIVQSGTDELQRRVSDLYKLTNEAGDLVDALIHCMIDFDEQKFEQILDRSIIRLGFEITFSDLIIPFMTRTGVLWLTGKIRISQEHFMTTLIRRKLTVAIDAQAIRSNEKSRRYLLFLPEGEFHDLMILYTEYILRKNNQVVANLGASLPIGELSFMADSFKPDFIVTFITVPIRGYTVTEYLGEIAALLPGAAIITGGPQTESLREKNVPNCNIVRSYSDFLKVIM